VASSSQRQPLARRLHRQGRRPRARSSHRHRRVFNSEDDCHAAVEAGKINPNDVCVIRYEGPRGGPGMREMLAVTAAIKGIPALSDTVALITDGRFSGAPAASW